MNFWRNIYVVINFIILQIQLFSQHAGPYTLQAFYYYYTLITPDLYNDEEDDAVHKNNRCNLNYDSDNEDSNTEELEQIKGRRCGYCRGYRHTVQHCTHPEVVNGKKVIEQFMTYFTPLSIVDQWIHHSPLKTIRAIGSSMKITRYSWGYSRKYIKEIFISHVHKKQVENRKRFSTNTDILDDICKYGSFFIIALPIHNSMMNDNRIKHIFECPICFDSSSESIIHKTGCQHDFCRNCMLNICKKASEENIEAITCPLCRTYVDTIFLEFPTDYVPCKN
jgi:hypothetical protein